MVRVLLSLILAVPLLAPVDFCPCDIGHDVADESESAPCDRHDPDCPCQSVDYGIRGFATPEGFDVAPPAAVCAVVEASRRSLTALTSRVNRDFVPIYEPPPRFIVYETFLI